MRMLAVGVLLLLLSIGLAEYLRLHPRAAEATAAPASRPANPLLATGPAVDDVDSADPGPWKALLRPPTPGAGRQGFVPVVEGAFAARQLRGGFNAVLFLADVSGASALVRAAVGEPAKVVAARKGHVGALYVDGSAAFFSEGGSVLSTGARGDEAVVVRARFTAAEVTSLAAVGDTVYVTLKPRGEAPGGEQATGAVARIASGEVTLVAEGQVAPRAVVADGKHVFWIAGAAPALWRAPPDGSYASRVAGDAAGPVGLDGDGVVFQGVDGGLWRVSRSGGTPASVAPPGVVDFLAASGLVRFTTAQGVLEATAGATPTTVLATSSAPRGLALAGTSLYVLTGGAADTTLLAQP